MAYGINNGPIVNDGVHNGFAWNDIDGNDEVEILIADGALNYSRNIIQIRFDDESSPLEVSAAIANIKRMVIESMNKVGR